VTGREKTLYGIYHKMVQQKKSLSSVLDIYGFRVIVRTLPECYLAMGILHQLYRPVPGKFKDYIAIPKLNGYQSLHTTLIGPYGTPVEFQIRTAEMNHVAESGVAAHWLYKNQDATLTDLQHRTHAWLQSLLDIQHQTGDPSEFLEHVKVDLFPDSVYVFTPKSTIIALPRGATALDFAYTIHTDIGDHAVSAKINHEPAPLKTELHNGDIVAIDVSDDAQPTPNWLSFVRTGRARSAIRHHLRSMNREQAIEVGELLLEQALISRYGHLGRVQIPFLLRSDNGLVFTSRSYTALVKSYGLQQEFITPYSPEQNGMVERVIRTLKDQCAHRHRFETLQHASRVIGDWIGFYNHRRPHQALKMRTPAKAYALAA
jgi:GTP pyrophosphokinase